MPSRKVLQIVATVLLVIGALVMLGFLGILIFITTGSGVAGDVFRILPEFLTKNSFIIPQYLAVVSYGTVAVFGLLQIYLAKDKHRWISFVKPITDFVSLLCAGAGTMSTVYLIITIFVRSSADHSEMVGMLGAQVAAIVIVIACHLASILVWKCSDLPSKDGNVTQDDSIVME